MRLDNRAVTGEVVGERERGEPAGALPIARDEGIEQLRRHQDQVEAGRSHYLNVILSVVLSVTCCLSSGLFSTLLKPGWFRSCHIVSCVGHSTLAEMPSTATTAV